MMVPLRRLMVLALIPLAKGGSSPDPWAEGVAKGKLALKDIDRRENPLDRASFEDEFVLE